MQPTVTFLVTTGRSGTQWLASTLGEVYSDVLVAMHEPVGYAYVPRDNLRDLDRLRHLRQDDRIAAHFASIHRLLESKSYVETGFPAYALAPLLREEFGARLRLVQLTRHPVKVAASLVTHGWYADGRRPEIVEAVAPVPDDPNVTLPGYGARWPQMGAFERALFYWHEVHRFGLEQKALSLPGTYARFRFEAMVETPEVRRAFLKHLGLPERQGWADPGQRHVDRFQRRTNVQFDWRSIFGLPEVVDLAERLGYSVEDFDQRAFAARYHKPWLHRLGSRLKKACRAVGPPQGIM